VKTPNFKYQTPKKLQASSSKPARLPMDRERVATQEQGLRFEVWDLLGVWYLVFGVFVPPFTEFAA
jgi:hypothetical protein